MKSQTIKFGAGAVAALALTLPTLASAGLVFDATILTPAQGFGTAPRALTLQATGQDTFASGGLGWDGSAITYGSVLANEAQVLMANGVTNQSGTTSLPNSLTDNQKYGVPTIGSLGITAASQIGVLFNATEPSGNSIHVTDVTLKFFTSDGTLLGAIDGSFDFSSSNPGNGVAGFTFVVDELQQPMVDGWLMTGGAGTRLSLEASVTNFGGGPETFLIYNLSTVTAISEPQTLPLMLAGLGAVGFVARRRRLN